MIRAATPADLEDVFELLTARSRAAFGTSELRRDHLAQAWRLPGTDRFVAHERGLIGYAELDAAHDVQVAAVDPVVNDALLEAIVDRAEERGFRSLSAVVVPEDEPFHALVTRAGFAHHGDVLRMWHALDDAPEQPSWPADVTVRTFEPADGERVHALLDDAYASWDETYVPRLHDDWLAWMTEHDEFDAAFWFLVERDGELIACALNWAPHEGRGWVKDIVVRADQRGKGLGRSLLAHMLATYAAAGVARVGLKVDSGNPTGAPGLYARMGFETDRRYGLWSKSL